MKLPMIIYFLIFHAPSGTAVPRPTTGLSGLGQAQLVLVSLRARLMQDWVPTRPCKPAAPVPTPGLHRTGSQIAEAQIAEAFKLKAVSDSWRASYCTP